MTKKQLDKRHQQEAKLLDALQKKHGYAMMGLPRGVRPIEMMFDSTTKKVTAMYVVTFVVPSDSALGIAVKKSREPGTVKAEKKGCKKS